MYLGVSVEAAERNYDGGGIATKVICDLCSSEVETEDGLLCDYHIQEQAELKEAAATEALDEAFGDQLFDQYYKFDKESGRHIQSTSDAGYKIKKNLMLILNKDCMSDNQRIDVLAELKQAMKTIKEQVES